MTEGEKQLLHGSVSSAAAKDYGHAASAEGLAKIIRLGDPALVRAFGHGLQQGQVSVLPPAVEALVIANFDHPTLGALLKGFQSRYQTRRLFDLHYARIATAYKTDDPSFSAIFNTDLAGIEEPLLRLAPKFPSGPRTPNAALMFLGQRKYPGAVPLLIAALEESYRPVAPNDPRLYSTVLQTLLAYPSVEVWRQTRAEIETLYRSGKIPAATHAAAARDLDSRLNDPPRALATIRWQEGKAAYTRKRDALGPTPPQIRTVRESDPRRYAREYRRYLEQLEQLAAEYPDQAELTPLATEYFGLGLFVRFTLKHPAEAVEVYSRAARYGHPLGHIAVADTYQFDLRDNGKAADSYQRALDELPDPASPGFVYPYRVVVLPSGYARSRVTDWLKGQSA